jgi:hypothetical protein
VCPFKFNLAWLQEEEFLNLVKEVWIPIGQEDRVVVQFSQNLKRLKKATMEWAKRKKQFDEQEHINIEATLQTHYESEGGGYATQESKE